MSVLSYLHLCNELVTWGRQENENYLFILHVITKEVKEIIIFFVTIFSYPRQNAEARWWPIGHHRAEAFWRNWNEVTFDSNWGFSQHIGEGGYSISSI